MGSAEHCNNDSDIFLNKLINNKYIFELKWTEIRLTGNFQVQPKNIYQFFIFSLTDKFLAEQY